MANYNITFNDFNNCTVNWGNEESPITINSNTNDNTNIKNPQVICECGFKSFKNDIGKHLKTKTHDTIMRHKERLVENNKLECERCGNLYKPLDYEQHLTIKCEPYDINNIRLELEKDFIHCTCNIWVHNNIINRHLKSERHKKAYRGENRLHM